MIELGLSRIAQLVKHTPFRWKAIHVAGTNGKGSITAYISAILTEAGLRIGRFNSPHLIDRWDCISIQERPVSRDVFCKVESMVKSRNEKLGIGASDFELLTTAAFEIFNRARVQVAVVEVGLGGRLDATNILGRQDVLVSVISKIGLDHQALLGDNLRAIAREKAGIMKEGVPCIVDGSNESSVLDMISDQALLAKTEASEVTAAAAPEVMKLLEPFLQHSEMAPHQIANLLLAVEAAKKVEPLLEVAKPINQSLHVVSSICWPGRLQRINLKSILGVDNTALLDGAHNLQAAQALSAYVDQTMRQGSESVTWILAMSEGKDVAEMVRSMVRAQDKVIATKFASVDGMPWVEPVSPGRIVYATRTFCHTQVNLETNSVKLAIHSLQDLQATNVVIAGSLYLVSDVLRLLRSNSEHNSNGMANLSL